MNNEDQFFLGIMAFIAGCTGFAALLLAYKHGVIQPLTNLLNIL